MLLLNKLIRFLFIFTFLAGVCLVVRSQSASLGNTFIHDEGEATVFGQHNFNDGGMGVLPGMVGTQREGRKGHFSFSSTSVGWLKASRERHIDGYVRIYGQSPFVFPIGDNGKYRPIAISGADQTSAAYYSADPEEAVTSHLLGGAHTVLPQGGPFPRNSKQYEIFRISDREYWDINGENPTRITLTWDAQSNIDFITDGQMSRLTIVGWDGDRWVVIPSIVDPFSIDINRSMPTNLGGRSNRDRGSITTLSSIVPNTYQVYTFASIASGIIGDLVWEDLNRNGLQDPGEPGIVGVQVQLYDTSNTLLQTTVSAADGSYFFQGVQPGRYYLRFNAPAPYAITLPAQLPPERNSDLGFDGKTLPFNLMPNQVELGIDAGYYRTGYIGGYAWADLNSDGIQDEAEPPMANVIVELLGSDGLILASTFTNAEGDYFFTNLPPGDYYIRFILVDGYSFSPFKATLDITKDSDANPIDGISELLSLGSGKRIENIDVGLAAPCKYVANIDIMNPDCGVRNGAVDVIVNGTTGPYKFLWSTGDTTEFVNGLDTGKYTLLITDSENCTRAFIFNLVYDSSCELICADLNTAVFLEGAYDYDEGLMHHTLNRLGYLPGQRPTTFFGKRKESGQPYTGTPWKYSGTEGTQYYAQTVNENNEFYDSEVVDWVLVSLRLTPGKEYEACTRAGLLFRDGHIEFPDDQCCLVDPTKEYYVVVEHRNHLIVMSPRARPVINGKISFDFRSNRSYVRLLGVGQKQVAPDLFVMFGGNGDQFNSGSSTVDINVSDLAEWLKENGMNSSYYKMDFDLNGDANVQDKALYLRNNGLFTDVPKKVN